MTGLAVTEPRPKEIVSIAVMNVTAERRVVTGRVSLNLASVVGRYV